MNGNVTQWMTMQTQLKENACMIKSTYRTFIEDQDS